MESVPIQTYITYISMHDTNYHRLFVSDSYRVAEIAISYMLAWWVQIDTIKIISLLRYIIVNSLEEAALFVELFFVLPCLLKEKLRLIVLFSRWFSSISNCICMTLSCKNELVTLMPCK